MIHNVLCNNFEYKFMVIFQTFKIKMSESTCGFCPNCKQPNTGRNWCQTCNLKRFQQNLLKARNYWEVMPYNRFRNIQYLARGGFSTIYKAIWLDGSVDSWDKEKQRWRRYANELKDKDYEIANQENVKSPLKESEKYGQ